MESSTPEKQPVRVTILSRPYTLLRQPAIRAKWKRWRPAWMS